MDAERIKEALQKADEAFWASIVESFPEIKTGDLHVSDFIELQQAQQAAVKAWVEANSPSDAEELGETQKFQIPVVRTSYAFKTIEVEAGSLEEAQRKALDEAGNHEFSEKNVDYITET